MAADLSGRSALITGAASGIGRASALAFASAGAAVALVDIDAVGLANTAAAVSARPLASTSTSATAAPADAKARALARPMPEAAPVISATRPDRSAATRHLFRPYGIIHGVPGHRGEAPRSVRKRSFRRTDRGACRP